MNATNRGVNRVILFVAGAVLLCVGAVAVLAAFWPAAADVWQSGLSAATEWMLAADAESRISDATTVSWFVVGVLAVLLVVVIAAVATISRLGGGRSSVVLHEEARGGAQGAVSIRHGFVSDLITRSLDSHDEIISVRVDARRLQGTDVLHVSVTPRQTVSPVVVAETVAGLLDNLATLLGRETPTFVSIHSGFRSRIAADQSRVA